MKQMHPVKLDFTLVPVRDHMQMWVRLPGEVEKAISKLPATAARIEMALRFCTKISNLEGSDESSLRQREGYMRAALSELVSVEDTLKWECPDNSFELWWSSNPLLHMLRELRNLNVHLKPSELAPQEITVRLGAPDSKDFSINIYNLSDLTPDAFSKLRNAKWYTSEEISALVDWFNEFHKHWGIGEAIHQGIAALSILLVDRYNL